MATNEQVFNRTSRRVPVMPWHDGIRGTQAYPIIDTDEDIVRVEAGPGTGKTFALVRRVQRILHPQGLNVPGDQVLIVAFNRVIAKQLQTDIDNCLAGSAHDGKPVVRTVHALCLDVIGRELRLLLPHEREAMIYDILHAHPPLRERYRRFNIAQQALHDHEAKHKEDMQLWQAVRAWLTRHKAELLSELPRLLADRLHGGDFDHLDYQHIIVDEFQDLTSGEQQLFMELRRDGTKFLALGDPRQSIYAFRGNDRDGLRKIDDLRRPADPAVADITMTECQRCPRDVVIAANQLMGLSSETPMEPIREGAANTHQVVWRSLQAESEGMARAIVANISRFPDDKHLVMVTRRQFGYRLREAINNLNPDLKIDLCFSESLLETWAVREAFLFFCLVVDPDAPTWRAWFAYQNSNDGRNYKAAQRNTDAYLRFLESCSDAIDDAKVLSMADAERQPPGSGGGNVWERAKRYKALKAEFADLQPDELIQQVFDLAHWAHEGVQDPETVRLDMEMARDKALDILQMCKEENAEITDVEQLKCVAQQLRYQIATREPFAEDEKADLQITTLWGAKGVTADHVYVIGLCAEAMPGERREEYPGTDLEFREEQRRLFYVSLTRSKFTLVLSRANTITAGEALRLGLSVQHGPHRPRLEMCPFLSDIIDYLPRAERGENWEGCAV